MILLPNGPLVVGTDFSGIDAPILACRMLNIEHRQAFACEFSRILRKFLVANHLAGVMYTDVRDRDVHSVPQCDVYFAGAPCQYHSRAGSRAGPSNTRGVLLSFSIEYCQRKKPLAFVFENVPQFYGSKMHTSVLQCLQDHYDISCKILDTSQYGVPQIRKRWYSVGILRSYQSRPLTFPPHVSTILPIMKLNKRLPDEEFKTCPEDKLRKANVMNAYKKATKAGINPFERCLIIDAGSSLGWSSSQIDRSMTLTRTRCDGFGYWCSTKGGHLSTEDFCRLQGFTPAMVSWRQHGISDRNMAAAIGNSMSVNVLSHLLPNVLVAAGLCTGTHAQDMQTCLSKVRLAVKNEGSPDRKKMRKGQR